MIRTSGFLACLTLVLGAAAAGCGSDCADTDSCGTYSGPDASTGGTSGDSGIGGASGASGSSGASGTGGAGGSGGDAATCDTTKSPSEESCLVTDTHAIFVSPTGSDSADGSKNTPVQSWEKALELGKAASKFVIACNDDFTTPVALTSAHSGTKLYGGFKCSDWTRDSAKKTRLAPSSEAIALSLDGVVGFHAEDVIVEAKDATTAGASSISVFANGSSNITLKRIDVIAGKGAAGANGVVTSFTKFPTQAELNGKPASGGTGGASNPCGCPGGKTTTGGPGGSAGPQGGGKGQPDFGGGAGGISASPDCAVGNGLGKSGAPAPATPSAPGATTLGTLTATGWTPSNGMDGAVGSPGQGGGGGASTASSGGGGGGCGGCGGAGGPGGKGGGSSIALLLFDTPLSLDATVTLTTKDAGKGGNGAAGQAAQPEVGFNGVGAPGAPPACNGGAGGLGAAGGAGGGAAGGVSAGILWKGTSTPIVDGSTTITFGAKGAKGTGGKSNDGIEGVAQDVLGV